MNYDASTRFDNMLARCQPSLDDIVSWIANNLNPEDVFDESQLAGWADDNGYKQVE